MKKYNLAFLGFGNVARALVQLLDSKRGELRERYGVEFAFTGVASRRLGWHANPAGFAAADLIGEGTTFTSHGAEHKPQGAEDQTLAELREWLAASQANVLFETMDDLVAAFRRGVLRVNGHRDRMGFMFDHDDVLGRKVA